MSGRSSNRKSAGHGSFVPDRVMESESYYRLSCGAKSLLHALAWQYKMNPRNCKDNNGNLTVAVSIIGESCGSRNSVRKHKDELIFADLIICTRQPKMMPSGRFSTALYGLSWLPIDEIWVKGVRLELDVNPTPTPPRTHWEKYTMNKTKNTMKKRVAANDPVTKSNELDFTPVGVIGSLGDGLASVLYSSSTWRYKVFDMRRNVINLADLRAA